jgi:hypothetical protein
MVILSPAALWLLGYAAEPLTQPTLLKEQFERVKDIHQQDLDSE